jgi:hypothetical protein
MEFLDQHGVMPLSIVRFKYEKAHRHRSLVNVVYGAELSGGRIDLY